MDELLKPQTEEVVTGYDMATVTSSTTLSGTQLRFDGEATGSTKRYKRLSTYSPANGDRVLLARVSGTYVILGKVVN